MDLQVSETKHSVDIRDMELSELTKVEKELNQILTEKEKEVRRIRRIIDTKDQEECKKFVGKCYKSKGANRCYKIIGTPQFVTNASSTRYDKYYMPAIIVDFDTCSADSIYEDSMYRKWFDSSIKDGDDFLRDVEISEEEFLRIAHYRLEKALTKKPVVFDL